MLFQRRFHPGLSDGSITITFRMWSAPRVKVGSRYRVHPIGVLEVDSVEPVRMADIAPADVQGAGFADRRALIAYLEKTARRPLRSTSRIFRVAFHHAGRDESTPPAHDAKLSTDEASALRARLERMDRLSRHGPWTRRTLGLIEKQPRVSASRLARRVGRETQPFKADVRKLKKLGLTLSFDVGYEISPRGRAFLKRTTRSR